MDGVERASRTVWTSDDPHAQSDEDRVKTIVAVTAQAFNDERAVADHRPAFRFG